MEDDDDEIYWSFALEQAVEGIEDKGKTQSFLKMLLDMSKDPDWKGNEKELEQIHEFLPSIHFEGKNPKQLYANFMNFIRKKPKKFFPLDDPAPAPAASDAANASHSANLHEVMATLLEGNDRRFSSSL